MAPFAPYLTEELWKEINFPELNLSDWQKENSIHNRRWPKYNRKLIKEKKATLVIQVNGRFRDKIEVEANIAEKEAKELALSREKIKKWTKGKRIKKIIFVPRKLINLVI